MVVLAVCVFGWVSYQRLSLDLMPTITYPTLTVRAEFPGTAPEEIENLVSRPLEQELGIVRRLVSISSISRAGQSDVILEFDWDTDMNAASQDVREKVDRVGLPPEAKRPLLLRYDPSLDPIMRIGLHGSPTLYALRHLAEHEIKRQLESVQGVAAVRVRGGLEEEIHVELNERQMALLGIDIAAINTLLAQSNINLPGGSLREGQVEYLIRTLNELGSIDEISGLVVARRDDAGIHLGDIARVFLAHKDREVITRVNGRESVEIEVYKEADANIVAVARRINHRLFGLAEQREYVENLKKEKEKEGEVEEEEEGEQDDLKAQKRDAAMRTMEHLHLTDFITYMLPAGAELEILSDQSVFIERSIEEVQKSALLGGAMAIVVLFVFLRNVVHTLIVGLTIPVSIIATFAPMHAFEVSLNIMSLGGLALGIGMLVDNSIVVLESIFRCREEGDDLVGATVRGTGEVGSAVFASTLTTIAVFFPIAFVEGIAGQVFGDMALTVVFSLLASLGVALYFVPMLASRQLRRDQDRLLDQVRNSEFLQLRALERGRAAVSDRSRPLGKRLAGAAAAAPYLVYEVLWRIFAAAATLAASVVKAAAILLFELLWWLAKPIECLWIKPGHTFQTTVSSWAAADQGGPRNLFHRVWPRILTFGAPSDLASAIHRYRGWIPAGGTVRTLIRALPMPLVLTYLTLRFVLQTVLRLAAIVLQVGILLCALALTVSLLLAGMALPPLVLPFLFLFERVFAPVQRGYPVLLAWALRRRLAVIAGALGCFMVCGVKLVPELGRELIPQVHQGEFNLEISLPVGSPLDKTARVLQEVEEIVLRDAAVRRVFTTVGTERRARSGASEGEHTGLVTVQMKDGADPLEERVLIDRLRVDLADLPEVEFEVSRPTIFSFKTPVEVEIHGHELRALRRLAGEAEAALGALPGLSDVRSSLQPGNPELQISYNRERLAGYDLSLKDVAELVRNKVQGRVPTRYHHGEHQIPILVRLQEMDRLGVEDLGRLVINPEGDVPIPLGAVAKIQVSDGPSEIRRVDQQRAALISANLSGTDLGTASRNIDAALRHLDYPTGFSYLVGGQNREMETSLRSLVFALSLAVFLVYIVMAAQFESMVHPLVIMFTVPLALIGVVAALYAGGVALSVVVFIGLIMLAGIVVNNAIVLVDYINTLRRSGLEKTEAIIRAGRVRLRPILMTTATTVLALLPMALGLGEGAEIRTPMAFTVIVGLTSSTVLTLIVIPTVYSLLDRRP